MTKYEGCYQLHTNNVKKLAFFNKNTWNLVQITIFGDNLTTK